MDTFVANLSKKRERTESILKKVNTLAPNPRVLQEVLQLLNNVNTSPATLAKAISKDQSVVLKILTIANSSLYGLTKRVSSIEFAIMVLKYDEIRNIVDALSLMESMQNKSDQYLDYKKFQIHSYIVASLAKKLALDMGLEKHAEAFIAGLLHDVGISVVHRFMNLDFANIHNLVANGMKYDEAELEVLGISHGEVGESLLKYWNIPEIISEIVRYHHMPYLPEHCPTLTAIIRLADYITSVLFIGEFSIDTDLDIEDYVLSKLSIKDKKELAFIIEKYREPLKVIEEDIEKYF